ncbi:MAG: biosynthetic-type acetolactate synthase large subunit, partial [Candidatus Margulisbacteria bacterium]|nr:biosynthetic-type acetolactate synthase large subunit [Candidatus Margulisiibacteriota bacterium]
KEGVDTIFGYPGGVLLEIYDEIYKQKDIKHYLVRHEQGAAHAADAYARSTGKVGVCLATSGPGATNLVTGLATAHMDSIPMVAFTGQVSTPLIGKDSFQEADITGITMPITKHNFLVKDVKDLVWTIKAAFYIASSGRPGPVLVDLPKDVTLQEAPFDYPKSIDIPSYKPTYQGNPKQIKAAIKLIKEAKSPVIIIGGGVILSNAAKEVNEFVNKTKFPTTSTLMGLGAIPSNNSLFLGMSGMHGTAYANYALAHCDLLIAIGMRFDDRVTGKLTEFATKGRVIHIDIDPAEINKTVKVNLPIIGDVKEVVAALNKELATTKLPSIKEWDLQVLDWKNSHPMAYKKSEDIIKPQEVLEAINKLTKGEAIYTTEVGENQMWAAQYLELIRPRTFLTSGGLGTMGYGLPAAIGAQVGNPDKLVIDIAGDGSIQMNIQEFGTAATYKLPVKVVILNNYYLGMVRQWQDLFYEHRISETDLINCQPDFMKIAEAYGIYGVRIEKPLELEQKLKEAFEHKGPAIIEVKINRKENVFPMVPAGGAIHKMLFAKDYDGYD